MACLSDGTILLPYRDMGEAQAAWLMRSTDSGLTWSKPEKLAPNGVADVGDWEWLMPFGTIRELTDGTVILPVHGEKVGDVYWRSGLLLSYDRARTWTEYADICSGHEGMDNDNGATTAAPGKRMWCCAFCSIATDSQHSQQFVETIANQANMPNITPAITNISNIIY